MFSLQCLPIKFVHTETGYDSQDLPRLGGGDLFFGESPANWPVGWSNWWSGWCSTHLCQIECQLLPCSIPSRLCCMCPHAGGLIKSLFASNSSSNMSRLRNSNGDPLASGGVGCDPHLFRLPPSTTSKRTQDLQQLKHPHKQQGGGYNYSRWYENPGCTGFQQSSQG